LCGGEKLQIVAVCGRGRLPANADFINLIGTQFRKIEAGLNGEVREAGIVFEAADALLGYGKKKLAIANEASGRVVHLGIVET
jgi:hypothetical protein